MRSKILFITERKEDAHRLSRMLHKLPLEIEHAETLQQARAVLRDDEIELILTEAHLPDGNWLDALHIARDCPRDVQVLVTDAAADTRFWAEALNLGAYDLIAQPFYEPEVRRILWNACTRLQEAHPMAAV